MNKFLLLLICTLSSTVFAFSPVIDCISGTIVNLTMPATTIIKRICANSFLSPNNTFFILDPEKVTENNATKITLFNFFIFDKQLNKLSYTLEQFVKILSLNSEPENKKPFISNYKSIETPDVEWLWGLKAYLPDMFQSNISDVNYFLDGIYYHQNPIYTFNTTNNDISDNNNYKYATICLSVFLGAASFGTIGYFIYNKYSQLKNSLSSVDNQKKENKNLYDDIESGTGHTEKKFSFENSEEDIESSIGYTEKKPSLENLYEDAKSGVSYTTKNSSLAFDNTKQEKTFNFAECDLSGIKKHFGYLYHYYSFKEYLRKQHFKYLLTENTNTIEVSDQQKKEYKNSTSKLNKDAFKGYKKLVSTLKDLNNQKRQINHARLFETIDISAYTVYKNKIIPLHEDKLLMIWLYNHQIEDLDIEENFDLQKISSILEELIEFKDASYNDIFNNNQKYKFATILLTIINNNYKKISRLWLLVDKVKGVAAKHLN